MKAKQFEYWEFILWLLFAWLIGVGTGTIAARAAEPEDRIWYSEHSGGLYTGEGDALTPVPVPAEELGINELVTVELGNGGCIRGPFTATTVTGGLLLLIPKGGSFPEGCTH